MIAVTGSSGFIGRAVVAELNSRDIEAFPVDRETGHDILDGVKLGGCDGVIHLAGVLGTAELFDSPSDAIDVNIKGTLSVLNACAKYGARYVGITMPAVFPSIYTATKVAAERLAWAFHESEGIPVSHVRAFNVFGAGQKLGPVQKIIPTFANCAWNAKPFPVWGSGNQTVDLVHVSDVARMLVDALAFGDCQTFDAGTGVGQTVNHVAQDIAVYCGLEQFKIDYLPMRKGEKETKIVAEGEGWDILGWKPNFNGIQFVSTIESYK